MDDSRFDQLTRSLAISRRQALRGLVGAVGGGVLVAVGLGSAAARSCGAPGRICREHANCCSNVCGPKNRSGRRLCQCATAADCPAPSGPCTTATCAGGACGTAVAVGVACDDGNPCTTNDTCAADGQCRGTPVVCTAKDSCHDAGVCSQETGQCSHPSRPDGSGCNGGDACSTGDTCQAGRCVAGEAVVCDAQDECHVAGVCDPATGTCSNRNAPDGTGCGDDNACTTGDTCQAGVCRPGAPVTCPSPEVCQQSVSCNPQSGACDTTNKPDGTLCGANTACAHDICQSGQCVRDVPKPAGTACNDATSCTQSDACDGAGSCIGGNPVTCPPGDTCHGTATCDAATGLCGPNPILPGNCFIGGACRQAGDLDPDNPCRVCDPSLNQTAFSARPNETACDDGDRCTQGDTCQNGVCTAGTSAVCTPLDGCHVAGVCDPATGLCSNPDARDGAICNDGNPNTVGDHCQGGVCHGTKRFCPPSDPGCDAGYECVNQTCFQVVAFPCIACDNGVCNTCDNSLVGASGGNNYLCVFYNQGHSTFCDDNSDCPIGSACNTAYKACMNVC
jgi:hypothetical protein